MFAPKVDINVKCIKCGETIIKTDYTGSWRRKKTGEECTLLRCPKCSKLLAAPLESKEECYSVRNAIREYVAIMH